MIINRYIVELVLSTKSVSLEHIRESLIEIGSDLAIEPLLGDSSSVEDYKIKISTDDPTLIFDVCSQIGKLKSVKIEEGK